MKTTGLLLVTVYAEPYLARVAVTNKKLRKKR